MNNEKREQQMMDAAEAYVEEVGYTDDNDMCCTMNDFCAGWRAADAHPQWIPVDEYPKVDNDCTLLVLYVDGTIDICDYYGDFYDYTGENVTRNVTHWMSLPAEPRKEANNV